jgi:hypothetical protein
MKERLIYTLRAGHDVEVEISEIGEDGEGAATKIAKGEEVARYFTTALEKVKEVANATVASLSAAAPEEIEVTFGVKLGGKTGLIITEGSAEANLGVKLKFSRKHIAASNAAAST